MTAPALAHGVRFRRTVDGHGVLLIPEGVVNLNESAAAIVELIDGKRTRAAIARDLCDRYNVNENDMLNDVETLLQHFTSQSWLSDVAAD